jgi:hypothetical protein
LVKSAADFLQTKCIFKKIAAVRTSGYFKFLAIACLSNKKGCPIREDSLLNKSKKISGL